MARESDDVDIPHFRVVSLPAHLKRNDFSCGVADLDEWFRRFSSQSHKSDRAKTFVMLTDEDVVVGYYASLVCSVGPEDYLEVDGEARKYPIPAILLARLAVDEAFQGNGYSRLLVGHALNSFATVADSVGVEIVLVHPIDDEMIGFYESFGFKRFSSTGRAMFMTMKNLRAAI